MHDAVGNRNGNTAAQRATRPGRWKGRVMSEIMSLVHTVLQCGMVGMLAKGGTMMLPLLAASVTSRTVIIERRVFWRRLRQHEVDTAILQYVAAGEIEQAITIVHAFSHPVARVLSAGLAYQHPVSRAAVSPRSATESVQFWQGMTHHD